MGTLELRYTFSSEPPFKVLYSPRNKTIELSYAQRDLHM